MQFSQKSARGWKAVTMRSSADLHFSPSRIFLIAALSAPLTITPAAALNLATPAVGFASAATAAARAGSVPVPGLCWYYTGPTRTQGFWDYCQ
jgi:hypothetical protein